MEDLCETCGQPLAWEDGWPYCPTCENAVVNDLSNFRQPIYEEDTDDDPE